MLTHTACEAFVEAILEASTQRHSNLTPVHLFLALLEYPAAKDVCSGKEAERQAMQRSARSYLAAHAARDLTGGEVPNPDADLVGLLRDVFIRAQPARNKCLVTDGRLLAALIDVPLLAGFDAQHGGLLSSGKGKLNANPSLSEHDFERQASTVMRLIYSAWYQIPVVKPRGFSNFDETAASRANDEIAAGLSKGSSAVAVDMFLEDIRARAIKARSPAEQSLVLPFPRVAIDLGTSRTKVAYRLRHDRPAELLYFGPLQRPFVPSLFALPAGDAEAEFGEAAAAALSHDPASVIEVAKRQRRDGRIRAGNGRTAFPIDLLTLAFGHLRAELRRRNPTMRRTPPSSVTLTVPVSFGAADRELWSAAARAAGFPEVVLLEEPVAAALGWLDASGGSDESVVVVNLGAGTVDWAWVRSIDGRWIVDSQLPPGGLGDRGSHDVDLGLLQLVEMRVGADGSRCADPRPASRAGTLAAVRAVKEAVCAGEDGGDVLVPTVGASGEAARVRLSRSDVLSEIYDRLTAGVLAALMPYVERVKRLNADTLPPVLLVGGGAMLAGLRDDLARRAEVQVVDWDRAEFGAVLGALLTPALSEALGAAAG